MKKTFGNPVIIAADGTRAVPLDRIVLGAGQFSEDWLQKLIFDHPELLPVRDIEPGFGDIVAVAREVPCAHGYIDNLYLTPAGDIVVVETKLWRNVQARREVVAQTLDYVAALTQLDYAGFEAIVGQAMRAPGAPDTLYGHVAGHGDAAEEARFVDAVALNLKRGRMLAIVVGDGIRQEAEALGALLQGHAGAHFTFALVELSTWRDPATGALIALPGTLAQTVMIERGIVVISGGTAAVLAAPARAEAKAHSITEELYFEALASADPALPTLLKDFLAQIEPLGVYPEFLASLNLKVDIGNRAKAINLGYITKYGKLWTSSLATSLNTDAALRFNEQLAPLIGGQVRTDNGIYLTSNGLSAPSIKLLLPTHRDAWVEAIRTVLGEARAETDRN